MSKAAVIYGLNWLVLLGVLATLIFTLVTDDEDAPVFQDVIQAESFQLVNDQGDVRGMFSLIDGTRPNMALIDEAGEFRAWLLLGEDGSPNLVLTDSPRMVLIDDQGRIRQASRLQSGSPVFTMHDAAGGIRTVIQLAGDGTPILEFYDAEGELLGASP